MHTGIKMYHAIQNTFKTLCLLSFTCIFYLFSERRICSLSKFTYSPLKEWRQWSDITQLNPETSCSVFSKVFVEQVYFLCMVCWMSPSREVCVGLSALQVRALPLSHHTVQRRARWEDWWLSAGCSRRCTMLWLRGMSGVFVLIWELIKFR